MASSIPEEYREAKAEILRLFDAGELTAEAFTPLCERALGAITGHQFAEDLTEMIVMYDPVGDLDTSEAESLGGADSA